MSLSLSSVAMVVVVLAIAVQQFASVDGFSSSEACPSYQPFQCEVNTDYCFDLEDACNCVLDCNFPGSYDNTDENPWICIPEYREIFGVDVIVNEFFGRPGAWMLQAIFNGRSAGDVATALRESFTVAELEQRLPGMSVDNFNQVMLGVVEGDERPALRMGMPERNWPEVRYFVDTFFMNGYWADVSDPEGAILGDLTTYYYRGGGCRRF